jgi:methyl-accepting chemotaxis protein
MAAESIFLRMVRTFWIVALILGVSVAPLVFAFEHQSHADRRAALNRSLEQASSQEAAALENYFERARSIDLLTANDPAFKHFYALPGTHAQRVTGGGQVTTEMNGALDYLEKLFPGVIGEACFIDRTGPENARVVRGVPAGAKDLSPDESGNPFFKPTFALKPGEVYQARPYVSPDTGEWVVSNSTPVPDPAGAGILHFEVTVESFRQEAAHYKGVDIAAVDAKTGQVVFDSRYPQAHGGKLGHPGDRRFVGLVKQGQATGVTKVAGKPAAFTHLPTTPHNANDWYVVAMQHAGAPAPTAGGSSKLILALAALIALAGLGVVAHLIRGIVRRIRGYADFAERVAAGDLTVRLDAEDGDELGSLAASLNQMVESLSSISGQMRSSAETLGQSAGGILTAVNANSASANEQSAAISEMTATVEEMRANADLAARKAEDVARQARESIQTTDEGAQAVQAIVDGMDDISAKVDEIAADIQALSERSEQISEITSAVNELADQSSLLSLNAAIEAARAGEQGKGFAVVADEVRKMADQSKQATAQVETILTDIKAATDAAVVKSSEGSEVVRAGIELASRAGEIIAQVATSMREAARAAEEITSSATQQSVGMDQIVSAIKQSEESTASLASDAAQSRAAAEGLDALAQELEELAGHYQVDGSTITA